jgi:hypothetical protein
MRKALPITGLWTEALAAMKKYIYPQARRDSNLRPGRQGRKHHALPVILTAAALHLSGDYELCDSTHLAFEL